MHKYESSQNTIFRQTTRDNSLMPMAKSHKSSQNDRNKLVNDPSLKGSPNSDTLEQYEFDMSLVGEIINTINQGVFLIDGGCNILHCNEEGAKLLECGELVAEGPITGQFIFKSHSHNKFLTHYLSHATDPENEKEENIFLTAPQITHGEWCVYAKLKLLKKSVCLRDTVCLVSINRPIKTKGIFNSILSKFYKLSDAESSVVRYLLNGDSNKDIAHKRNVSTETVKKQVQSILEKTHSVNRTHLASKLINVSLACS